MTPRVSVLVAARDAAATLPETLASVRGQTFGDWEAIVVDDGSSDDTAGVAEAFGDPVRVIHNASSRGPAAARNQAAREARGQLLATLDADDAWLPNYLESQIAAYERAAQGGLRVGVVCCDADLVSADGSVVARWSDRVGAVRNVDMAALLSENVVFTSVLCPREVFLELGGYDEDPRLGVEDYDLWLRMLERGYSIVVNREVLVRYRLSQGQSAKVEQMAAGAQLVFQRALERGALTPRERRIARRRMRLFRVVERRSRAASQPSVPRRVLALVPSLPLIVWSTIENPQRWWHWLRRGPRSAGADRHMDAP